MRSTWRRSNATPPSTSYDDGCGPPGSSWRATAGSTRSLVRTSRPVRRVLLPPAVTGLGGGDHSSWTAVASGLMRPTRWLGRAAFKRQLYGLAPDGVYRAATVTRRAGGLLPHPFTLTHRYPMGGLLSVALSRGSPRVAVSHRPALWSPDVPQPCTAMKTITGTAAARSAHPHGSV